MKRIKSSVASTMWKRPRMGKTKAKVEGARREENRDDVNSTGTMAATVRRDRDREEFNRSTNRVTPMMWRGPSRQGSNRSPDSTWRHPRQEVNHSTSNRSTNRVTPMMWRGPSRQGSNRSPDSTWKHPRQEVNHSTSNRSTNRVTPMMWRGPSRQGSNRSPDSTWRHPRQELNHSTSSVTATRKRPPSQRELNHSTNSVAATMNRRIGRQEMKGKEKREGNRKALEHRSDSTGTRRWMERNTGKRNSGAWGRAVTMRSLPKRQRTLEDARHYTAPTASNLANLERRQEIPIVERKCRNCDEHMAEEGKELCVVCGLLGATTGEKELLFRDNREEPRQEERPKKTRTVSLSNEDKDEIRRVFIEKEYDVPESRKSLFLGRFSGKKKFMIPVMTELFRLCGDIISLAQE
eukprot:CAMPEP_0167742150 /NCGR_PEP_ID=MMETSP0110_2-20121227/1264_1 /TAXON_ID=629695 /ORGANISM="Gymnochlora sp., Strain CCMP2014" /LENGTH=406 /DNA_ID=CAMNT_0007626305 /DNA_START=196 /DNA_END=1416 /DNA_ORIENTATION=+